MQGGSKLKASLLGVNYEGGPFFFWEFDLFAAVFLDPVSFTSYCLKIL